jgi:hypothetical protein
MAVFTPRGLKLRLSTAFTFAFIARVHPTFDSYRILQTTEIVKNLGGLATFLSAVAAFSLGLEPLQIGALVFVAVSVIRMVQLLGLFVPPITFLLPISRAYGSVAGYAILLAAIVTFGFFRSGWVGVMAFVLGRLACGAVFGIVEWQHSGHVYRKTGLFVSSAERSFFHAFQLEANRLGASTDLRVADNELAAANWRPVLEDLAVKWPEIVARFTVD